MLKGVPKTAPSMSGKTSSRFFRPVQAHMVESAQSVLATTTTPSQSATAPSYGTGPQVQCERMSKAHGRSGQSPNLFQLASSKRMPIHQSFQPPQMLRLWKVQPWSSDIPSCREGMNPLPLTTVVHGWSSFQASVCGRNTLPLYRASWRVLTSEY